MASDSSPRFACGRVLLIPAASAFAGAFAAPGSRPRVLVGLGTVGSWATALTHLVVTPGDPLLGVRAPSGTSAPRSAQPPAGRRAAGDRPGRQRLSWPSSRNPARSASRSRAFYAPVPFLFWAGGSGSAWQRRVRAGRDHRVAGRSRPPSRARAVLRAVAGGRGAGAPAFPLPAAGRSALADRHSQRAAKGRRAVVAR